VDFAAIARAMGAEGERVARASALPAALGRALDAPGPYVLDVLTSADASPTVGLRALGRR
jgi:thiamine pyrophosphate-dependent acetolactate synthase large subunit-like protein